MSSLRRHTIGVALFVGVLTACAQHESEGEQIAREAGIRGLAMDPEPLVPSAAADAPELAHVLEICTIRTRDHLVTVYSTPEGTRYTVRTLDGELVSSLLPLAEFQARHPDLEDIRRASIGEEGTLDASLRGSRLPDASRPADLR